MANGNAYGDLGDDPILAREEYRRRLGEAFGMFPDLQADLMRQFELTTYKGQKAQGAGQEQAGQAAQDALMAQGQSGSQALLQALLQGVEERNQQMGQQAISNASSRGLLHSGYGRAVGRDLERERSRGVTQAHGSAQDYLLRALSGAGQLGLGHEQLAAQQQMAQQQGMMQQLAMIEQQRQFQHQQGFGLSQLLGAAAGGAGGAFGRSLFGGAGYGYQPDYYNQGGLRFDLKM